MEKLNEGIGVSPTHVPLGYYQVIIIEPLLV